MWIDLHGIISAIYCQFYLGNLFCSILSFKNKYRSCLEANCWELCRKETEGTGECWDLLGALGRSLPLDGSGRHLEMWFINLAAKSGWGGSQKKQEVEVTEKFKCHQMPAGLGCDSPQEHQGLQDLTLPCPGHVCTSAKPQDEGLIKD